MTDPAHQHPLPASLWAAVTPPGPETAGLIGTYDTDVCVVGGGLTGLATALHLVNGGRSVMLVEAAEVGWGASGRNNGQVIPTLSRVDPDGIVARHGEAGERMVHMIRDSAQDLFSLIRTQGLAAEAEQTGWLQPAHSPGRARLAERRVAQWQRHRGQADLLSSREMADLLGSTAWHGGWRAPTGGHVNPLALVRELTRVLIEKGCKIYSGTTVNAVTRTRVGWVVTMPRARITAQALVLATNAYTDHFSARLAPELAREIVPVRSWQMATTPIDPAVRERVIGGRQAVSDTHGELYFMRYDARNRLVSGGALIRQHDAAARLKTVIAARLQRLFPALGAISFDYVWSGTVGITRDFLPRFHMIGPHGYAWTGCNGRALALSASIGREFARAILGTPHRELALPFTEPDPIRFHGLAARAAPLALARYRWRDTREV